MLVVVAQAAVILGLCALGGWFFGFTYYVITASFVFLIAIAFFVSNGRRETLKAVAASEASKPVGALLVVVYVLVTSAFLAAIWPALPVIIARGERGFRADL
jgi:hypothetical protein